MADPVRISREPDRREPQSTASLDPRHGDVEDDASSPERRSWLALVGSVLAEISLPKMAAALIMLVVVPGFLLGVAPLVASIWIRFLSSSAGMESGALLALALLFPLIVVGWYGGRRLIRIAERSFWSLNALAVQPGYAACREVLLHIARRVLPSTASEEARLRMRAATAAVAGVLIAAVALWIVRLAWPTARWVATPADLRSPYGVILPGLANSVVLIGGYLAVASLVWGIGDAMMPQPRDVRSFRPRPQAGRRWRVAHLSDIHVVGERYGFRLGSGRAGPRGNECFLMLLRRLDEVHRERPLDAIVITGDLTDAGRATEWAELLDMLSLFPQLADLIVAVPGNHDLNVVDRANPARLDLPTSPKKRLRQIRTISALAAMQGERVCLTDGATLAHAIASHVDEMSAFADSGKRRFGKSVDGLWLAAFPMVRLPDTEGGLGIIAIDSNAETHFSFTNALGLIQTEQARAIDDIIERYPRACWIVALHHHIVEHPALATALADRIGTTLINGSWFTRRLQRHAHHAVVMHGHRHIDWIGRCGDVVIVSAPSQVMNASGNDLYFYVHTLGAAGGGRLELFEPERIMVQSQSAVDSGTKAPRLIVSRPQLEE